MTLFVIKIGTSLIRGTNELPTSKVIALYSKSIALIKERGDQVIIVTSGAVGLGCDRLNIKERPTEMSALQASAAVGQIHLMSLYQDALRTLGYDVAQILLTRSDLCSKSSYRKVYRTFKKLLDWRVIPIVNENDALSSEELRYGDNDTLSALVANLVSADQLILLTDVDKLYSSDPRTDVNAKPISEVKGTKDLQYLEESNSKVGEWGTGGIRTKLSASRIATSTGIKVHLADGRDPNILRKILNGEKVGTVFHPREKPLKNLKSWLAHAINSQGTIYIDQGAYAAIKDHGASLLLVGIKKVDGNFTDNQPVLIKNLNQEELGRGISSLSSEALRNFIQSDEAPKRSSIVINRDVLVLTNEVLADLPSNT